MYIIFPLYVHLKYYALVLTIIQYGNLMPIRSCMTDTIASTNTQINIHMYIQIKLFMNIFTCELCYKTNTVFVWLKDRDFFLQITPNVQVSLI